MIPVMGGEIITALGHLSDVFTRGFEANRSADHARRMDLSRLSGRIADLLDAKAILFRDGAGCRSITQPTRSEYFSCSRCGFDMFGLPYTQTSRALLLKTAVAVEMLERMEAWEFRSLPGLEQDEMLSVVYQATGHFRAIQVVSAIKR